MRVTERTNFNTVRDSISTSRGRLEKLQHQNATMRKLNAPSDDPVGAAKVLEVRTDKLNNDQYMTNAKLAETFLTNSDHALSEMADLVVRAKEIAIGQSSGASSNENSRLGVAEEVTQLYNQAIAVANRRVGERYLFGGYQTTRPPVDENGKYRGDDGKMMVEIGRDVFISMNVPGFEAFNTQPEHSTDVVSVRERKPEPTENQPEVQDRQLASLRASGGAEESSGGARPENVNVFDELQALRIGLLTGDLDSIRSTLERFDSVHGQLVSTRAKIGSRVAGMQSATQALERHNVTNAMLTSTIEDADMAQVVSDLAKEETVFRSALASSQKLMQPTLIDFLK